MKTVGKLTGLVAKVEFKDTNNPNDVVSVLNLNVTEDFVKELIRNHYKLSAKETTVEVTQLYGVLET